MKEEIMTDKNTSTAKAVTRTRTKEGYRSLFVTIPEEKYAKLEETADGRPINLWLSRLIDRHFETMIEVE